MNIYLVGGAVRDLRLGYPVNEKDWVVVGARPDTLLAMGYQQVGKDFPVFLHPKTKEEYALARTERKSAPGYYGFECRFDEHVTLEDDLKRRDLTINAMAEDAEGRLIDPYGGLDDLNHKLLRHVSDAFIEDPVRVLRVARFAARYHHLGFTIADETLELMAKMVRDGELTHLVPERVWQEWSKSLTERHPERFIMTLRACGALRVVLPELDALFGVPNPKPYHPEVDSGIHTLMVLQAAVVASPKTTIRFAALLHDVGKAQSPMAEWPHHYGHEHRGEAIVNTLCQRLRIPAAYRDLALKTTRFHLTIQRVFELRPTTIVNVLEHCDAFRKPDDFKDLLIACEADARAMDDRFDYPLGEIWRTLCDVATRITAKAFVDAGLKGIDIKNALHQERVKAIKIALRSLLPNEK